MIERFREIISRYVPENTIWYCTSIWEKHPFSFKVTKQRRSKVGDYRFNIATENHEITVNGSLNPYAFLITYLHEVAHLIQFKKNGNNQPPHGKVWKKIFQELMNPVLSENIFTPEVLQQLERHMQNPKASSNSDPALSKLLRQYDRDHDNSLTYLEDLSEGELFRLNGRTFTKLKKRRTRSLCKEKDSGRKYLISEMVQVSRDNQE